MTGFFPESELISYQRQTAASQPKCGACGLSTTCKSPKMAPTGTGRKRILIVAEAPGKHEDEAGRQLVGNSGKQLSDALANYNIDLRRDCVLTNALICRPEGNEIKDKKQIDYCRPNLLRTIEKHQPEVIVLLGGTAVSSLIGHLWGRDIGKSTRWTGWRIPSIDLNAWICPTHHPARLLREKSPVLDRQYNEHLKRVAALSGRPYDDGPPDYPGMVETVLNPADAATRIRKYRSGRIAFDFETTTLKPDGSDACVVACSICWEGRETIAYPWTGPAIAATKDLLENPDVEKVGSNIKFEHRWALARLGIRVFGWKWDTMLAAHALDSRGGISSIKFQAFVRLGFPDYDVAIAPFLDSAGGNTLNRIREVNLRQLLKYNGLDSLLEYFVADKQMLEMGT